MTTNSHESVERAERYARHVSDLCAAFHILIHPAAPDAPQDAISGAVKIPPNVKAMLESYGVPHREQLDFIRIVPVINETTYAVALHEIGHILAPLKIRYSMTVLTANIGCINSAAFMTRDCPWPRPRPRR